MNKFAPFVEWLWSNRNVDRAFLMGVVTDAHRNEDSSVPSPGLTTTEALALWRLLEKKDLVSVHRPGESYLLNTIEEYKWEELIRDLKKSRWMHSQWYKRLTTASWVVMAAVLGGFVGG